MLADQLDFVVGVDPHRDSHAIGVVEVPTGVVVFEAAVSADIGGYEEALRLAEQHAPGRRAFAVEGTGSFGAGLTRFLVDRASRCSRSADSAVNVAPAARPTPSTRSARREASLVRSDQRGRGATENVRSSARSWQRVKAL